MKEYRVDEGGGVGKGGEENQNRKAKLTNKWKIRSEGAKQRAAKKKRHM